MDRHVVYTPFSVVKDKHTHIMIFSHTMRDCFCTVSSTDNTSVKVQRKVEKLPLKG